MFGGDFRSIVVVVADRSHGTSKDSVSFSFFQGLGQPSVVISQSNLEPCRLYSSSFLNRLLQCLRVLRVIKKREAVLRAPPTNNRENAHTAPTQKDQSSYPSLSLSPFLFAFHRNRRNINIWKGKIYTLLGAQTNLWRKCRATAETLARATTGLLLLRWVPLSRKARKKKKTHTDSVINLLCIFNEYLGRILFVFILHRRRAAKWLRFFFFLPDNLQLWSAKKKKKWLPTK